MMNVNNLNDLMKMSIVTDYGTEVVANLTTGKDEVHYTYITTADGVTHYGCHDKIKKIRNDEYGMHVTWKDEGNFKMPEKKEPEQKVELWGKESEPVHTNLWKG